jgi:hypothetical protein
MEKTKNFLNNQNYVIWNNKFKNYVRSFFRLTPNTIKYDLPFKAVIFRLFIKSLKLSNKFYNFSQIFNYILIILLLILAIFFKDYLLYIFFIELILFFNIFFINYFFFKFLPFFWLLKNYKVKENEITNYLILILEPKYYIYWFDSITKNYAINEFYEIIRK